MNDNSPLPVGISYSGGASSRWMIDAILNGELKRPEHVAVFFADTGDEHGWTYDDVAQTEERCRIAGLPFFRCADRETLSGSIMAAINGGRTRADTPPFWTENPGGGRGKLRQECTVRFKTAAIRRVQSEWLRTIGMPKKLIAWIGFAADEAHRATKAVSRADVKWVTMDFPAIRLGKNRAAQRADVARWSRRPPPKFSMCVTCPFKDPSRWFQTQGADLAKAIDIDEAIRHGLEGVGVEEPCFLVDRLIPLERLIRNGDPQPSLPGFDTPGCDGGACFL